MEQSLKVSIAIASMTAIISSIVGKLWDQITPIFQNVFFLQNIPINQTHAYVGIILFAGTIVSGLFLILFLLRMTKKKPIDTPPTGIQYEQIACPKCNYPNIVYPPTKEYKIIVFSECKDQQGEEDHNVKDDVKCRSCRKNIDFYWCKGHSYIVGLGNKRKYRSKLDPSLRDVE